MVGPVGASILALSVGCVVATRNSRDRGVRFLACYIALTAALSLIVHLTIKGASGRASPMMLLDVGGLYVMGLWAACRLDQPTWLYALISATAAQCGAHLLYVADVISGDIHTLALNVFFLVQVGALITGRYAMPEDDLGAPLLDEALT